MNKFTSRFYNMAEIKPKISVIKNLKIVSVPDLLKAMIVTGKVCQ